nr:hypothetical protein [Salmonella sp.]
MVMMNWLDKEGEEFATQANHPQWLAERRADVATIVEEFSAEITTNASVKQENSRPTTKSWILTLRQRLKFTVIMGYDAG